MVGSSKVLSVVYIRTCHLIKHTYNCFEESKLLKKTTIMKEVIEEKKVFRSGILTKKEVHDEIQRSVSFIKDELQSVIEKNIQEGGNKENLYWLHADGLRLLLTMNPMERIKNSMNKIPENMTYLMDNKKFLCQHKKLDPLTARRGKWIPETLYREIEKIVNFDSQKCVTPEGEETLVHQELTNCEIKYDQYHCYDCSQSLCLEIQSKKESLKKYI